MPGKITAASIAAEVAQLQHIREILAHVLAENGITLELDYYTALQEQAQDLLKREHEASTDGGPLQVAVIGDFSSGKSSFINSLIGERVCPVGVPPTTSSLTRFRYGPEVKILRISDDREISVSVKDYFNWAQYAIEEIDTDPREFVYFHPTELLKEFNLVDTPGFGDSKHRGKSQMTMTMGAAHEAQAVFFVHDVMRGPIVQTTIDILRQIQAKSEPGKPWFLVLNKADRRTRKELQSTHAWLMAQHGDLFRAGYVYASESPRMRPQNGTKQASTAVTILTSEEMRSQLRSLKDKKIVPLTPRLTGHLQRYHKTRVETLKRLHGDIGRHMTSAASGPSMDFIHRLIKPLQAMWTALGLQIALAVEAGLKVNTVSRDEKFFLFEPYARISFKKSFFKIHLRKSDIWDRMFCAYSELSNEETKLLGTSTLAIFLLDECFEQAREASVEAAARVIDKAFKGEAYYENEADAEAAIVNVLEEGWDDGIFEKASEAIIDVLYEMLSEPVTAIRIAIKESQQHAVDRRDRLQCVLTEISALQVGEGHWYEDIGRLPRAQSAIALGL